MIEAKLQRADVLKKVVEAIKDLVKDAPFDCTESSIMLQAMDSSHVALVALKLDDRGFESFRCDRQQSLGISLETLSKILKCSGSDDTLTLRFVENTDVIDIIFEDSKKEKVQECQLKLMDIDMESLGIPEQDYACVITMPSNEFQKVIRDLSMFTDSLQIICTKGELQFVGKGDNGTHKVKYGDRASIGDDERGKSKNEELKIVCTEAVNITFAIKYMGHFVKATNLSSNVKISISPDVPIVVEYEIDDASDEPFGYLRYYLAPKIDDDDNAMPEN